LAGGRVVSSVLDRRAVRDTFDRAGELVAFVSATRPIAVAPVTLAGADATAFVARTLAVADAITFALVGRADCCHNCTDRSLIPNLAAAAAAPWRCAHDTASCFVCASYRRARCGHGPPRPRACFFVPINSSVPVRSKAPDHGWKL
jgi:hypothetical protein